MKYYLHLPNIKNVNCINVEMSVYSIITDQLSQVTNE